MDPGHVGSAGYLCPAFVVTNGPYASQNVGMRNTGQQGDALLSSSSRGWRGIHAGKGCPGFSQESCRTRIESASPTLINRNGKPPHAPIFSAYLLISSGCQAGKLAMDSHFTVPFPSSFSVLISVFFSISLSAIPSPPSTTGSCSSIPAASKHQEHQLPGCCRHQRQDTASRGAGLRYEDGACGDLQLFLLSLMGKDRCWMGGKGGHILQSCWKQAG